MNNDPQYNELQSRNRGLRLIYTLLIITVIALGILSRKVAQIPLITGDILYAVMMFLIVRLLWIKLNYRMTALISLSISYAIEISQLYQATWIKEIRDTTLGALVLGHGFLWSDIAAYTVGTGVCLLVFSVFQKHQR